MCSHFFAHIIAVNNWVLAFFHMHRMPAGAPGSKLESLSAGVGLGYQCSQCKRCTYIPTHLTHPTPHTHTPHTHTHALFIHSH